MTAYASFADYLQRAGSPHSVTIDNRASVTTLVARTFSSWLMTGSTLGAGVAPTTAAVPTRTIAGAIGQINPVTEMRLARTRVARNASAMLVLCDRLSHQGGLSAIVTTAQTTNLPTAALTRYTSGVGVMAALEIYSVVGGTATTVACSYTNQAGTNGRITEATNFGGANYSSASRFLILPLQKGDSGVRAVANVDLVASTLTAGNFGVTLFKPLLCLPFPNYANGLVEFDGFFNLGGQLPQILTDACLFWVIMPAGTFGGQTVATLTMTDNVTP